jgi:multidrug efflux pump
MQLPEICIKRPVFATVMSLMIVLLGVISFDRLTVREYPRIDTPVVSVRTVYKGASAQVIESQVTQPLQDSLSGIEGVRTLKSVSREEVSQITVEFVTERDVDAAANDVRDRVARVRARLPESADESVVSKIEADAQAIMWLAFFSDRHDALELSDYVDRYVADRLKTLPGVASVMVGGERKYAMRIWIDRERLAAYALTVQDVESALRRQNVEIPAGRIESAQRDHPLRCVKPLSVAAHARARTTLLRLRFRPRRSPDEPRQPERSLPKARSARLRDVHAVSARVSAADANVHSRVHDAFIWPSESNRRST